MRWRLLALFLLMSAPLFAGERIAGDFNFDGYPDYRVERPSTGRFQYWDFYLFDPTEKRHVLSSEFSDTLFNPTFIREKREIHCISPGDKNPALYYEEDYHVEEDGKLQLLRIIRQEKLDMKDGQLHFVRISISMVKGKPEVESITAVESGETK